MARITTAIVEGSDFGAGQTIMADRDG